MVSIGISNLSLIDLIFVHLGVKINGDYYHDVFLSQQLLPLLCDLSGDFFIFQHGNAPAPRAHDTLCDFWSSEHPLLFIHICDHRISLTLLQLITRHGVTCSSECNSHSCTALMN